MTVNVAAASRSAVAAASSAAVASYSAALANVKMPVNVSAIVRLSVPSVTLPCRDKSLTKDVWCLARARWLESAPSSSLLRS